MKAGSLRSLVSACVLCMFVLGCKSADEKCEDARLAAEAAWRLYTGRLEAERKAAIAVQARVKLTLARDVEPRLTAQATATASTRYEKGTDAWQRAFVVAQSNQCGADTQCASLKHEASDAQDAQEDLEAKLRIANLALEGVRKGAQRAKDAADSVTPELGDTQLVAAKQKSDEVFAACASSAP